MAQPRKCDHPARRDGRCILCFRAYQRRYWRARHARPEKSNRRQARKVRSWIRRLDDWYIRKLLSQGTNIPPRRWPEAMVTLKRAAIIAKRALLRPHRPSAICHLP